MYPFCSNRPRPGEKVPSSKMWSLVQRFTVISLFTFGFESLADGHLFSDQASGGSPLGPGTSPHRGLLIFNL